MKVQKIIWKPFTCLRVKCQLKNGLYSPYQAENKACVYISGVVSYVCYNMETPCLSTPVGTAWLTGKISNFKTFSGVRRSSKFLTREITKPTGDNMKILLGKPYKHTVLNQNTHIYIPTHTHTYIYICVCAYMVWRFGRNKSITFSKINVLAFYTYILTFVHDIQSLTQKHTTCLVTLKC